ncbi:hypothetical protein KC887_03550 [Candidatus Kaiserbacteria bacterium]|nr:hypothetical protein [Candidatus Kaiserbacteria bacterium]
MMYLHRFNPAASAVHALVAACVLSAVLLASFLIVEPTVGRAQASDTSTFTITQKITDESSFLVDPTDVYMQGSINGVSGGQATGTTQFVVQSNNATGYYVEIAFFDNVGQYAMIGTSSGSEAIHDYDDAGGEPSYGFTASTAAQFAYTVTATSTTDLDQSFLNNSLGAANACNSSGGSQFPTGPHCWKSPSTSAFKIIDRNSAAISGATSTITFQVTVPSNAVPVPQAENYVATATLSLFTQ